MELKSPSSSLSWILGNFLSFLTLLLGRAAAQDEWLCYTHVHFHLCYKLLSFLWKLNCLSVSPFLSRSQRNIGMTMKSKSRARFWLMNQVARFVKKCLHFSDSRQWQFGHMEQSPWCSKLSQEKWNLISKTPQTVNSELQCVAFISMVDIMFQRFLIFQILWCGTRPRELIRIKAQVRNLHPSTVPETLHWDLWGGEIMMIKPEIECKTFFLPSIYCCSCVISLLWHFLCWNWLWFNTAEVEITILSCQTFNFY